MATAKVISGRVLNKVMSKRLYSVAPRGDQVAKTMTLYQSYYSDTEPTSPCPVIIMLSAWLGVQHPEVKSVTFKVISNLTIYQSGSQNMNSFGYYYLVV